MLSPPASGSFARRGVDHGGEHTVQFRACTAAVEAGSTPHLGPCPRVPSRMCVSDPVPDPGVPAHTKTCVGQVSEVSQNGLSDKEGSTLAWWGMQGPIGSSTDLGCRECDAAASKGVVLRRVLAEAEQPVARKGVPGKTWVCEHWSANVSDQRGTPGQRGFCKGVHFLHNPWVTSPPSHCLSCLFLLRTAHTGHGAAESSPAVAAGIPIVIPPLEASTWSMSAELWQGSTHVHGLLPSSGLCACLSLVRANLPSLG